MHWSEYLAQAIWHGEAMKFAPIQIDIAQLAAALNAFQREQARVSGILGGSGFDSRLIQAR